MKSHHRRAAVRGHPVPPGPHRDRDLPRLDKQEGSTYKESLKEPGLGLQKAERGWDNLGCYNEASRQLLPVSLGASQSHQLNLEEGLKGIKIYIYSTDFHLYIKYIYLVSFHLYILTV